MNIGEKTKELAEVIYKQLLPEINKNGNLKNCVFLELPYYENIGDILIWHGTECFLNKVGLKCLYASSWTTYDDKKMKKIINQTNDEVIIFLQGGGNFGDLWNSHRIFRNKIIQTYAINRIIILPQTIFYNDKTNMEADAELFARHNSLTICARDKNSYEIMKKNFKNNIALIPDMAFCIPPDNLNRFRVKEKNKTLFLKRKDKELNDAIDYLENIPEVQFETHDWPPKEKNVLSHVFLRCFLWVNRRIPCGFSRLIDAYASVFFKPNMIKTGVKFISKYNKIYTTRLHVAILCCLLEKPYVFFDNSYGKNKNFYETWLIDLEKIEFKK